MGDKLKFAVITFGILIGVASFVIFIIDIFKFGALKGLSTLFFSSICDIIFGVVLICICRENKLGCNLSMIVVLLGLLALLVFIGTVTVRVIAHDWYILIGWFASLLIVSLATM